MKLPRHVSEAALAARLARFEIETPSWGYADTGTRFGKFLQDSAAATIDEKLADAAEVHRYTGCCPSVAVHVLWDFPERAATRRPRSGASRSEPGRWACGSARSIRTCSRTSATSGAR